jgi:hypothetical protein
LIGALLGGPLGAVVGAGIGASLARGDEPAHRVATPAVTPEDDGLLIVTEVPLAARGEHLAVIRVADSGRLCDGVPPFVDDRGAFLLAVPAGARTVQFFLATDAVIATRVRPVELLVYLVDRAGKVVDVVEARLSLPSLRPFDRARYARPLLSLAARFACAGGRDAPEAWPEVRRILAGYLSLADERVVDAAVRGSPADASIESLTTAALLRHPDVSAASLLGLLLSVGTLDAGMTRDRVEVLRATARGAGISAGELEAIARSHGISLAAAEARWRADLEILGVGPNADGAERRAALRRGLLREHPDRHASKGPAAEAAATRRTVELRAAYDRLSAEHPAGQDVPPVTPRAAAADIDSSLAELTRAFYAVRERAAEVGFPFFLGPPPLRNQAEHAPELLRRNIAQLRLRVERWVQRREDIDRLQRRAEAAGGPAFQVTMLDSEDGGVSAFERLVTEAEDRRKPAAASPALAAPADAPATSAPSGVYIPRASQDHPPASSPDAGPARAAAARPSGSPLWLAAAGLLLVVVVMGGVLVADGVALRRHQAACDLGELEACLDATVRSDAPTEPACASSGYDACARLVAAEKSVTWGELDGPQLRSLRAEAATQLCLEVGLAGPCARAKAFLRAGVDAGRWVATLLSWCDVTRDAQVCGESPNDLASFAAACPRRALSCDLAVALLRRSPWDAAWQGPALAAAAGLAADCDQGQALACNGAVRLYDVIVARDPSRAGAISGPWLRSSQRARAFGFASTP